MASIPIYSVMSMAWIQNAVSFWWNIQVQSTFGHLWTCLDRHQINIQHCGSSTKLTIHFALDFLCLGPGISGLAVVTKNRCVPSMHLVFHRCVDTGGYHTAPGRSRDTKRCPWKAGEREKLYPSGNYSHAICNEYHDINYILHMSTKLD